MKSKSKIVFETTEIEKGLILDIFRKMDLLTYKMFLLHLMMKYFCEMYEESFGKCVKTMYACD